MDENECQECWRSHTDICERHYIEKLEAEREALRAALQSLADYQFAVEDRTGELVKQHCKDALGIK